MIGAPGGRARMCTSCGVASPNVNMAKYGRLKIRSGSCVHSLATHNAWEHLQELSYFHLNLSLSTRFHLLPISEEEGTLGIAKVNNPNCSPLQ